MILPFLTHCFKQILSDGTNRGFYKSAGVIYFNLVDGASEFSQKVWENQIFYYNEF